MKQGGDRTTAEVGFTIVETLIVLAVTSSLLLSAMVLINGRQNRTQFMSGINDIQQRLQQLINQTESGYYPNLGDFSCAQFTDIDGKKKPRITTGTPAAQGTNGECVFLGNSLVADASDNSRLGVVTLVANRLDATGQEATSFRDAFPVPLSTTGGYTRFETLPNGLEYVGRGRVTTSKGTALTLSPAQAQVLNFASTFGTYDSTGEGLATGTRQLGLYGSCTVASTGETGNVNAIKLIASTPCSAALVPDASYAGFFPLKSAEICFASGGTNQSGLITIGGSTSGLTVSTQIKQGKTCGF